MTIPAQMREQVRRRADFACEYCSVTETDAGGELTVDHYQPQSQGGGDDIENLVYCCHRCNEYKSDYWPQSPDSPELWNPRQEPASRHFVELADGRLYAATATGTFTVTRLRLNRTALIAHRLRRRQGREDQRLLARLRDLAALLGPLQRQHTTLLEEHRALLQEQRRLLAFLVGDLGNEHDGTL